jgi:hypothetical protein
LVTKRDYTKKIFIRFCIPQFYYPIFLYIFVSTQHPPKTFPGGLPTSLPGKTIVVVVVVVVVVANLRAFLTNQNYSGP